MSGDGPARNTRNKGKVVTQAIPVGPKNPKNAERYKGLEIGGLRAGLSLNEQAKMIKNNTISGRELHLFQDVPDHMLPGLLGWRRAIEQYKIDPDSFVTAEESDKDKHARLESEKAKREKVSAAYAKWNAMTKEEQDNQRKREDEQRKS